MNKKQNLIEVQNLAKKSQLSRQVDAVLGEKPLILQALDSLALALTNHNHKWTIKERYLYEKAIKLLI